MTPATTGPELIPIRSSSPSGPTASSEPIASRMSRAMRAITRAWSARGVGTPAATM